MLARVRVLQDHSFYCFKFIAQGFVCYLFIVALIAAFFIANPALAQDPSLESDGLETGTQTAFDLLDDELEDEVIIDEVVLDEIVTFDDLGVTEAGILPDSPWHVFKRFGRGLEEAFTFNPVNKAARRLENANQQLSEIQQLIQQRGLANIDPQVLSSAMDYYGNKLEQVKNQSDQLRNEKQNNQAQVDGFLDELTDKQFKQQKVFDNFTKEVINLKKTEANDGTSQTAEQFAAQVEDSKEKALENFSATLIAIDANENIAKRLTDIIDRQPGSDLNDLKYLALLEGVADSVPETSKEAIKQAKKNTIVKFEQKIKKLPPSTRANKFKKYVAQATSDETRLMTLLEEIKRSADMPADVLARIEEAKEITVRKFEEKLRLFEDVSYEERLVSKLKSNEVGDMVALKEFRNRMRKDSEELVFMTQAHDKALQDFKAAFTDPESQAQAEKFARLSKQIAENPNAKTFELLKELEAEVTTDSEKTAFLSNIELNMKRRFEDSFRRDGDRFFDKITTLDPADLAVFENLDFTDDFENRFAVKKATKFKDFMKGIDNPDEFDAFQERWFDVPEFVLNEIRENDNSFQDAMQFKARKMFTQRLEQDRELERAKLDFQERELHHQFDLLDRQQWDEFDSQLSQISWEDFAGRKALWETRINQQLANAELRYSEQKDIFSQRIQSDPWCDVVCKQIQDTFLEQELRHEKERLAQDLVQERNRIERERDEFKQSNPLLGRCDSPEACEQYCFEHAGEPGCEWQVADRLCPPQAYFDSGSNSCIYDNEPVFIACEAGEYFNGQSCVADPYWRAPADFEQCPKGMHWNDRRGFCEADFNITTVPNPSLPPGTAQNPNYCPPGQYFDPGFNACVTDCGPGYYYDGLRGCVSDTQCPPGSYLDYYYNECVTQCAPGEYYDYYEGRCIVDRWQDCPPGQYFDPGLDKCVQDHVYCPYFATPRVCDPGEVPFPADRYDPCGQPSCIVSTVNCPVYDLQDCSAGFFRDSYHDTNGCWTPGQCIPYERPDDNCSLGEYFDYFLDRCVPDNYACLDISVVFPFPCAEGYEHEIITDEYGCRSFGECIPRATSLPQGCPDIYNPVCGTNSETYSNDCYAREAGVSISYYGTCGVDENDCSPGQWWEPSLSLCIANHDYVPSKSGDCSYGWIWNPSGYCEQDESIVGECSSFCTPTCGSSSYCQYDQFGCATGCVSQCPAGKYYDQATGNCQPYSSSNCGNNVCDSGEDQYSCPVDCTGNEVYPGSESSCPGFAYSRWDSSKVRYCQLNSDRKCDYNYPSYLTNDGSYKAANCPAEDSTEGWCGDYVCNIGETVSSCPADCSGGSSCNYNGICDNGETYNSCTADCSSSSCPATQFNYYTSGSTCDYSVCSKGCNYDTTGCPTSCTSGDDYCGENWEYSAEADSCVKPGVTCSNPTACSACPSGNTSSWCQWDLDGCPTGCQTSTATDSCNYNNYCDSNESSYSCPADCDSYTSTCNYNGSCEVGETYEGCSADCPSGLNVCGNGSCEPGEDSGNCSADCGSSTTACNYNGYCDSGESSASCPADCSYDSGSCGSINDQASCESTTDCYWHQSTGSYSSYCYYQTYVCDYDGSCESGEDATQCGDCSTGSSACNYDGYCDSGESTGSCPADCGSSTATACNSNGYCDSGEDNYSCPGDCYSGGTGDCNYNSFCDVWETESTCASDCGSDVTTCNYNGYCDSNETSSSCASDCSGSSSGSSCASDYNSCYSQSECEGAGYGWCNGYCWSSYESSSCASSSGSDSCGDYICGSSETESSCPSDCGSSYWCGDGNCDSGEDSSNCSADCQPAEYCGDGSCNAGETYESCGSDCPAPPPPPPAEEPPPVVEGAATRQTNYAILDTSVGYGMMHGSKSYSPNPLIIFKAVFGLIKDIF